MTTKPKNDWYKFDMEQAAELERLRKENESLLTQISTLKKLLELQRQLSVGRAMIIQDTADRLKAILKLPDSYSLFTAVYDYCRELEGAAEKVQQELKSP